MHTAQHIVSECLNGPLVRDRTVVLVTHHITLCLPTATYLLEVSHGKVVRQGFVEDLRRDGQLQKAVEDQDGDDEFAPPDKGPEEQAENEADVEKVDSSQHPEITTGSSVGKLIEVERRAEGRVAVRTYWTYIKAAGIWCWIVTLVLMVLIRLINILAQVGPHTSVQRRH
jgi:ABC-type multidrug transport system ATPase subunit